MKKRYWIALGVILFIIIQVVVIVFAFKQDQNIVLDDTYLAVFKSESGERVNSTYIFVKKDKKNKKKYKYINTISTPEGYDGVSWKEEIVKKGTLKKRKDIYKIAEKHGAYSYVYYEDGKVYSIDEFKTMFK